MNPLGDYDVDEMLRISYFAELAPVTNSFIEKYTYSYMAIRRATAITTQEKIIALNEKYADNDDEDAYKRELEELVGWWKSDEYAAEFEAKMEIYQKNEELGCEDSMLIGYWKCGDNLLHIYYDYDYESETAFETVNGIITIEATLTEKTGIPEDEYTFIDVRYHPNEIYTNNYSMSFTIPDGYASEEYGDMSLSITITINDNDSINIEYKPRYKDSNDETVYLDTTTETYTRYNPTDE